MIRLKHIYKSYRLGEMEVPVLRDINLHVKPHEFVSVLGPSGSGKSTLMNIIGCLDVPDSGEYIIKSSLSHNPGGISFGLYSNYNHQDDAFSYFGKRPVDRTDFYKWSLIEKEKGVYTWPSFNNCLSAHRAGSTIICNVDISANLKTNPYLSGGSRIPDFYSQDITDNETRTAAKEFLRQFVIKYLNTVKGDVMLAIDYEIDFQQGITGANQAAKAERFAEWYAEACETARAAAGGRVQAVSNEYVRLKVFLNYQ